MLKINEIYHSIQGESTKAGLPCVFIRLTYCNLRCTYCDTEYAFYEGYDKSIDEVIKEVKKYNCNLIFMTDGLPELFNSQNEMLGMERIKSRLLSSSFNGAESLLNLLLETANDWKGDHPLQDDVTLLVIKMK